MFALNLIFSEIILMVMGGRGTSASFTSAVFFSASFGLFFDGIECLFKKRKPAAEGILLLIISLYFSFQSVVKDIYGLYFSVSDAAGRASNVLAMYSQEVKSGVILGTGRLFIFMIPFILFCVFRYFRKKETVKSGRKRAVFFIVCAVIIQQITAVTVLNGPDGTLFSAQYNLNYAAEKFGLCESTLLSFIRSGESTDEDFFIAAEDEPEGRTEVTESSGQQKVQESTSQSEPVTEAFAATASEKKEPESSPAAAELTEKPEEETEAGSEAFSEPAPVYNEMELFLPGEEVSKRAAALTEYIRSLSPSEKNEYTGIFEGKNLIMICAESYCDAFIRPELTPTLWRLTHNGFYFPAYYQPTWGGSTTTGELSMLLGLDSTVGNEAMQRIADNNHYLSMGNQLRRLGYFSMAFHNGSHTFYRRDLTHENLGYDVFYASGNGLEDLCGHSYPGDSEMIAGTLSSYIDKEPFSIYYMTVSGHPAYEKGSPLVKAYYDEVNAVVGDEYYEKTKYYICYQMELEKALTTLVTALLDAGIADDTVIVLTADHYPYGLGNGSVWHNDRDYINDLIKGKDSLLWNEDKTGLIIWSGCLENELSYLRKEVAEPVMSLDILPTISNLFGVEFDSRLLPGRDVFADTEPLVFWNNLSWVTEKGKYNTRKHEFIPEEGYEPSEEEQAAYIEYVNGEVSNKISMCTAIMDLDYYELVFGESAE